MPSYSEKKPTSVTVSTATRPRPQSGDSTVKSPRTARFAEATTVCSPIEPSQKSRNPFADPPTNHYLPQPQPSDVGFGYLSKIGHESVEMEETDRKYLPPPTPGSPMRSPLKSALKSPGAPPKDLNMLRSPTFREEQVLEKADVSTDKEQVRDLKAKMRVRAAKFFLRGVNFSCSLIVLSMITTTVTIFNATKSLPPRNNLPPWAQGTNPWPQIVLLTISSCSLFMCLIIFYGYIRGGHRRAEKVAVYYTSFAVLFFCFSIVMWAVAAAILNQTRANSNGQDIWGWSCKDNKRRDLFQAEVSYALICRLQNWSLVCCIIEVVVEILTILIYGVVFYRYYSKRRLRKSMARRDAARSDLYLAQLRSQSAPNTPGFGPASPRSGGWIPPPLASARSGFYSSKEAEAASEEDGVQYATMPTRTFTPPKPFSLQPPPIKIHAATPKLDGDEFGPATPGRNVLSGLPPGPPPRSPPPPLAIRVSEVVNEHAPVAQGERQYGAVAIPGTLPGAYETTLNSPGFASSHLQGDRAKSPGIGGFEFGV